MNGKQASAGRGGPAKRDCAIPCGPEVRGEPHHGVPLEPRVNGKGVEALRKRRAPGRPQPPQSGTAQGRSRDLPHRFEGRGFRPGPLDHRVFRGCDLRALRRALRSRSRGPHHAAGSVCASAPGRAGRRRRRSTPRGTRRTRFWGGRKPRLPWPRRSPHSGWTVSGYYPCARFTIGKFCGRAGKTKLPYQAIKKVQKPAMAKTDQFTRFPFGTGVHVIDAVAHRLEAEDRREGQEKKSQ